MNARAIPWVLTLALLAAHGMTLPAAAQLPNEGWNLVELAWLSEVKTEYGNGEVNLVLETWNPADPPSGGASGYITASASCACEGEGGYDASGGVGGGEFYCRFEWGGPGSEPTNVWYLDGFSEHSAEGGGVSLGPFASSYAVCWAGVGDRDSPEHGQICTFSSWSDEWWLGHYSHYHPITGATGAAEWVTFLAFAEGGVLEGRYPYGDVEIETAVATDGAGEDAAGDGVAAYSVAVEVVMDGE